MRSLLQKRVVSLSLEFDTQKNQGDADNEVAAPSAQADPSLVHGAAPLSPLVYCRREFAMFVSISFVTTAPVLFTLVLGFPRVQHLPTDPFPLVFIFDCCLLVCVFTGYVFQQIIFPRSSLFPMFSGPCEH